MSVTRMLRACVCAVALLSLLAMATAQMGDDSVAPVMVPRQSLSDELQLSDSEPVMMRRDHTLLEAEAEMEAEVDAEKFPTKAELVNAAKKAAASVGKAAKSVAKAAAKDAKQAAIKSVKELATKAGEMLIKFGASDPQTLAAQTAAKAAADDLAKKVAAEKAAKAAKAAQKPKKAVKKSKADKKDKKSSKSAKKDKKKSPKKADKKKSGKKADKKSSKQADKSSKKSSKKGSKKADKKKDSKKGSKKSSSAKKSDKKDKKSSKSSKKDKKSKSGKSGKSSKKGDKKSSKSGSQKAASKSKKQRSSRSRDSRKPRGPRAQRGPRAVAGWGISAQRPPRVQQRLPEARLTGAAATLTRANVRCVLCQFIVQKVKNELVAGSDDTAASASLIEAFAFANAEEQSRITSLVEVAAAADAKASALPQLFESGPDASRRFRHTDVLASRAGRARFTQVRAGTGEDAAEQRAAYLQLYSSVYASFEGLCAKRMPLAYLPYCNDMLKSYRFFAQGINYGDRAEQICMNANFCDHRSYVRTVTHNAYQREPGDA
jgi:hypothetical protein